MSLPNIGETIMFRKQFQDVINTRETPSMACTTYGMWMHAMRKTHLGVQAHRRHAFNSSATQYYCYGDDNSFIRSPMESHEYLMKTLLDKLSKGPSHT